MPRKNSLYSDIVINLLRSNLPKNWEIIEIDGFNVADLKETATQILNGKKNTKVSLTYMRNGERSTVMVKRGDKTPKAVPVYKILENGVGYIALDRFTQTASREVENAVKLMLIDEVKGIVLDLRNNPGGLVSEAVKIVNLFVEKGEEVVSTKGKIKSWEKSYVANKTPLDTDVPLVVLINSSSASASEIVSGSIQDLDRGVVIGQRSYGKGLVQQTRKLSYNSQLKLTVAKYYIPSGRCIQALDYSSRNDDGSVGKVPDSLMTSFETRNGREVKDGGGILPDIITEPGKYSMIIPSLLKERLFFDFATDYRFSHDTILYDFEFSDADFLDFTNYISDKDYTYETATEKSLKKLKKKAEDEEYFDSLSEEYDALVLKMELNKEDDLQNSKGDIKEILTGEIMSRYYYQKGRLKAGLNFDIELDKAIEILQNKQQYNKILDNE